MVVKKYENARAYLDDYEATLLQEEAVSQLILYNAYQNVSAPARDNGMFGAVLDEDKILLLFCNVIPYNLVIYVSDHEHLNAASGALADFITDNQIPIMGINAKHDVCLYFMERYKKSVDCNFVEKLGMDIMEIREVNDIKPVEGISRLALKDEVKLITDWMIQFQIEALASEMDYEAALKWATKYIEEEKIYVYENEEQVVVSMAVSTRRLLNGIAISYVYTPEEYRGNGYAAANIYYTSKNFLENGNQFCTLFVDKKNPLSNRAYEKVGFYILEDNYDYKVLLQ